MTKIEISFILNDRVIRKELNPGLLTLDFIRDNEQLKGTKQACREGDCGSCLVLVGELSATEVRYKAVCSCLLAIGELQGKHLVTIEGLNQSALSPVQEAFLEQNASQCGYCTPGFIVAITSYFLNARKFSKEELITAIEGNICRCTGYASIIRAADELNKLYKSKINKKVSRISELIRLGILPSYFNKLQSMIKKIPERATENSFCEYKLAGGTDLYVQQEEDVMENEIFFISGQKGLDKIVEKKDSLLIGAGISTEDIKNSIELNKYIPGLNKYLQLISSQPIRNQATLGGNIVNASPIADLSIIFLALGADLIIEGNGIEREIKLKDIFKGYKVLNLKKNEIIKFLKIPKDLVKYKFNFEKVSKREFLDIATVNTAITLKTVKNKIKDIRISAGGVSPIPLFLRMSSEFLIEKEITVNNLILCTDIIDKEISPISDVRGSALYKRNLLKRLFYAHFITLFPKLKLEKELL